MPGRDKEHTFLYEAPKSPVHAIVNGPGGTRDFSGPFVFRLALPKYDQDAEPLFLGLQEDQTLYYRDKRSGIVKSGKVCWLELKQFGFRFGDQVCRLEKSVVCKRLFFTKEDAAWFGKKDE